MSLHSKIAKDAGIETPRVWCRICGRDLVVDGAVCLANGWPKCCGYTQTIDSPEKRETRRVAEVAA